MAPGRGSGAELRTMKEIMGALASGTTTARTKALDGLLSYFKSDGVSQNVLDDKSYHSICESLFRCTLAEKETYFSGKGKKTAKTSAATELKLKKCAEALRLVVTHGAPTLRRKTARAIIDHVTQVLPGSEGDYFEPLLQDYLKAFAGLLSIPHIVETLAQGEGWEACVDFCVEAVKTYLGSDSYASHSACGSPAPSILNISSSRPVSGITGRNTGQLGSSMVGDVISCLSSLLSAPNAPIYGRAKVVSQCLVQVLQARQNITSLQKLAFSAINHIFIRIQVNDLSFANSLARDLVPLIAYWWQSRASSRDAMLTSVREELMKVLYGIHLHLDSLTRSSGEDALIRDIEDLLDTLWSEYSKRDDKSRLSMDDISFGAIDLPPQHFRTDIFCLRPYHTSAETNWALLENVAILETIVSRRTQDVRGDDAAEEDQPRKRRKVTRNSDRVQQKLKSLDPGVRLTAMQLIPFLLQRRQLTAAERSEAVNDLSVYITSKGGVVPSWAMLACSSLILDPLTQIDAMVPIWKQMWQIGARAVSLPGACRAACVLLRNILMSKMLPHHELADEINQMITAADVSGPALLVDSSLALMLELLRRRNAMLPNASQLTSGHLIRWAFTKWNPAELTYASLQAKHAAPFDFVNLQRACCGLPLRRMTAPARVFGGAITQFWTQQEVIRPMARFLLLLDDETDGRYAAGMEKRELAEQTSDSSGSHATKRLILELLMPKIEELAQVAESWQKRSGETYTPLSAERLQSLLSACVMGALLLPELVNTDTSASQDLEKALSSLCDNALKTVLDMAENEFYLNHMLMSLAPYIPAVSQTELVLLKQQNDPLLRIFAKVSSAVRGKDGNDSARLENDRMEVDEDFDTQGSLHTNSISRHHGLPRRDLYLNQTREAFYLETGILLHLLQITHEDNGAIGVVPDAIVNRLSELPAEQLLCCRSVMHNLFSSDLITTSDNAAKMIKAMGAIISQTDLSSCEASLCTCIEVMDSLISTWSDDVSDDAREVSDLVGDLYYYLVKKALPNNLLSPRTQIWLSKLLLRLLEVQPTYAEGLKLSSCRTTLLTILRKGNIEVQYHIGINLPKIFGLYVLKTHEDILVDILHSLPSDFECLEGIAYRVFVLAELACRWPTLLRRCIYHIFEVPGKFPDAAKHAETCFQRTANHLKLDSPRQIFKLFAPQLLYTWLDTESIQDIPFSIFGYADLSSLLRQARTEIAALMIMRGQEQAAVSLAQALEMDAQTMIREGFTKIIAYCFAHDINTAIKNGVSPGQTRVIRLMGEEAFHDHLHLHFADIVATFFTCFDQDGNIEDAFQKDPRFHHAAKNLEEMKSYGFLDTELPANQQPEFKARYLQKELEFLCNRSAFFELEGLWTPTMVVSIARKLLSTIHSVLGPLHACSVLRKLRVLVSIAGPQALSGYPLEMLLHSLRAFVVNAECADDALGMSRYLLQRAQEYLVKSPSFLAGYALSTMADLRIFLESTQSSTTQETQFKKTRDHAQGFHDWFEIYLKEYDSPHFKDAQQRDAFRAITISAGKIGRSGNAEKGTYESALLLEIWKDGERENQLLNAPAREVALSMLCGTFRVPASVRDDVVETDEQAISLNGVIWKSCSLRDLSQNYLSWAGRVLGRSFAASGEVSAELLSESRLEEYRKITTGDVGSEEGLLRLVEMLTVSSDCQTAGLAESALRVVVSHAVAVGDQILLDACQKSISNTILVSSNWVPYRAPPSDNVGPGPVYGNDVFAAKSLETPDWVKRLAIHLALSEPDVVTLSVLPPLLEQVNGFAEQAFPFVVHLVLDCQHDKQQEMKRHLSEALKEWLKSSAPSAKDNLKLLINTILYLRMQALPNEASIADRTHWLDVNFDTAASAATRCGMNKVALLFSELASSELSRASRRSSVARESEKASDVLLEIFENIDDPDAYYGLKQDASLATVLSRLEYENDGTKSLAFRGAQYDSHLRRGDAVSDQDGQALVKILCSLGLSGLSNSLLQVLQSSGTTPATLDSTFTTSRRLETWNLPASGRSESHAVTLYKAYQSMQKMGDVDAVRAAIHDGLSTTILQVTHGNLNASNLRQHLGSLAALTELDDLLHVADSAELQGVLSKFEARSKWMMSGRYSDVSQILSCRETTLSMITQHPDLRPPTLSPGDHRLAQIRGMLLSSDIFRFHRATQETLNLSTTLTHLVDLSESEGLSVGAAVSIDTANSLWDHGEMTDSIEMLKKVDRHSSLKKQSVAVSRSDLLSKIAHQVSVARLEPPDSIQKSYLEPALKELRGRSEGKEAGKVFHQFAMFCDQQLQDSDNLEDLARLQSLKRGKNDEVVQLKTLISNARDSQAKNRYQNHLNKAKQWLELDQQELRRVEQTRNEFVKLSLENYLLSLTASDEHNNDALRFTALWLERAEDATTNDAVQRSLAKVPTRKFAPLMNQLSSRLQDSRATFQNLLIRLVQSICLEHPYHGMYQVWSGAKTRPNREDEVAVSRQRANEKVAKVLAASKEKDIGKIWTSIDATNRAYHALALDRDANRYKTGQKMPIKDSSAGPNFLRDLARYPIPPPTMQVKLSPEKDYSKVPLIVKFEPNMCIASGVSAPKIITARGSDGKSYKQLVKGGNDDLRQDAIMEQAFAAVSELLRLHRTTRQRNLGIRTYKVLPLTSSSGLIEFVQDTIPLHEYLMPAHERYYPRDFKGSQCRKEISNAQTKTAETRVSTYRKVTDKFHPVMRYFFMEYFPDPDEWFARRTAYTRTTAAISMLGHVLGLGDRHGHNILLDSKTGEVVHIDLGVAFEMGRVLPVPELVPFRLTRDIVDGMGITKTEGVFRRCCEFTLDALREETYSIMTILDVLRYDPLYTWSISPVRMAKLQHARAGAADDGGGGDVDDQGPEMGGGRSGNEPSEADRALEVVRKKLSKTLSVTATVNDLINQATDERNLAMLYSGWAAYA